MRRRLGQRRGALRTMLVPLLAAGVLYAPTAIVNHPAMLVSLLAGDAAMMLVCCRMLGFSGQTRDTRNLVSAGFLYSAFAAIYGALVALLVAWPIRQLADGGSLSSALLLSVAFVVAIFCLFRIWPIYALPFISDDLPSRRPQDESSMSMKPGTLIAQARELTAEPDVFFRYGLPPSFMLALLAISALATAGIGFQFPATDRIAIVACHALLIAPLANWLLLRCTLRAWLAQWRPHPLETTNSTPEIAADAATDAHQPPLADDISQAELDETLLRALRSAQVQLALDAIERGADANAQPAPDSRDQRTPVMIAVTLPDLRPLRALIAKRADVNGAHGGITPLIAATRDSYEGRPDAVTMLVANGADAGAADAAGNTPLHHAARCENPIIAALLLDTKVDINAVNADGHTALDIACANANWPLTEFLLDHRAAADVVNAVPALCCAAGIAEDDTTGVRLLLKHRAKVDATAPLGRTALMTAALAGHARIVDALLAAGANVDIADQRGTTALMEAARAGAAAAIHALGKRKVAFDALDAGGRNALMHACQSRQAGEDTVRALLALGADRSLATPQGQRAVDLAAAAGRWPIVALLDPAYPVPSSFDSAQPVAAESQPNHLLDALRFGHWNIVAGFSGIVRDWSPTTLAELYLDLAGDGEATAAARAWLLNHGLDGAAKIDAETTLLDELVERLPESAPAFRDLVARGAAVGGAGLLARVLETATGAHVDVVRALAHELLARGADAFGPTTKNAPTTNAPSALHAAIAVGDEAIVDNLLERGCDPNARNARGDTPLHLAVARGADAIVRQLVAAGANPGVANACGDTALGAALARRSVLSRWLAWPNWPLPLRRLRASDMPDAAARGDADATTRLRELGLPLDGEDAQGATALIRAAGAGHAALLMQLLDAGADAAHVTRSGMHVLAAAVAARREAVVRTLLNHQVAPDTRIAGGGTALTLACALGESRIVDALLEAGADANALDDHGGTPLHAAAQYAFSRGDADAARAVFERLLRAGAQIARRNRGGQDALLVLLGAREAPGAHCDAEQLRTLCEWLVDRGAAVDTQDERGVGALHACALHGLIGCVRLLKAHGAPLDLVDAFGRSAADVAALVGYVDVAAELGLRVGDVAVPGVRQTLRRPARAPD